MLGVSAADAEGAPVPRMDTGLIRGTALGPSHRMIPHGCKESVPCAGLLAGLDALLDQTRDESHVVLRIDGVDLVLRAINDQLSAPISK